MARKLQVTVRGARLTSTSKPSTYCSCILLDDRGEVLPSQSQKTKVINSSSNPVWEQLLEFTVGAEFHGIKLELFDKRKFRSDKLVGQFTLKINPAVLDEQEIMDEWFPLKRKQEARGDVQLRVHYADRGATKRTNGAVPPNTNTNTNTTTINPTSANKRNSTQMDIDSIVTPPPTTTTTTTNNTSNTNTSTTTISAPPFVAPTSPKPQNDGKANKNLNVTTEPTELKKSASWEAPETNQNLLKRSYVIIEDENMENADDDTSEPATPPPTRGKSIRTSFAPSVSDDEPEQEDEDDEDNDGDNEDYNEDNEDNEDVPEDDDKDYADWDMEEEEAPAKPKSLSASGIFQAREAKINKVKDILGVPPHIAQALLQHYQWDEEKFLMRFLENPAGIYKEAKIEAPKERKDGASSVGNIVCSVCFEDNQDEITALSCNHYFCNDCWRTHIEVAIKEGRSLDICCMQHKCKELMPDYIVRKIVDLPTYQKYSAFLTKGFVESNANMKWCPKPGCTHAVDASQVVREGKCVVAKCECGYKFCFLCSEESHTPATCNMMKEWAKKCADDSETYNWIAANTKDCPQKNCGVPIEKNDGCFMMTCQKCRHQFCWLCCEPWSSHNDHFRCNKYNEAKLENKPTWLDGKSNTDARQALDRYLFYYNRYINHQNSLKFEDKTRDRARQTMDALQKNGSHSYIDVQFIEAALNQLLDNRRTLKNTYVYAFYQADPLKKDLFEFSQADLEKITEKMGQLLLANPETLIDSATTVKSMTQVASRSLTNLLFDENL